MLRPCQKKHSKRVRKRKLTYQPEGGADGPGAAGLLPVEHLHAHRSLQLQDQNLQ